MKKVRLVVIGTVLLGMTSCSSILESMNVNCDDDISAPRNGECVEFSLGSNCE